MSTSHSAQPAAIPLLLFVGGLAGYPFLDAPAFTILGLVLVSVLVLLTRSARRIRLALLVAAIAAGLIIANLAEKRRDRDVAAFALLPHDAFVTVEIPLGLGWQKRTDAHCAEARSFTVISPARTELATTITICIAAAPPATSRYARIRAQGFLQFSESGRFRLWIKSPRLLQYVRKSAWYEPRTWNRRAAEGLDRVAVAHPSRARAVALVQAIALGRSGQLPRDIRESYRRGGTYHLLVFSGMQIAFAAGLVNLLFRHMRRPRAGDLVLLALAIFAPLFTANEASVARSAWMIGLFAVSRIAGRPTSMENLLFVSALVRLMSHPEELTDPGFMLTYGATGGLILLGKRLAELCGRHRVLRAWAYGAGAELATTPLTIHYFHQYVAGSSLVTLLLAPILSLMLGLAVVVCLTLNIAPPVVGIALDTVAWLDMVAMIINEIVADSLRLAGVARPLHGGLLALCCLITLLIGALKPSSGALPIIPLILFLLGTVLFNSGGSVVDHPQIEFLDVGQGDAILLRDRGHNVLVDGGGSSRDSEFGRRVLIPLLLERGVKRLDAVALTHPDPDHCGGLLAVVENLEVDELWLSSRHFDHSCSKGLLESRNRAMAIRPIDYTEAITIGTMRFEPIAPRLWFKRSPLNNTSIVFRVSLGRRRVLLTGDIEKEAERLLVSEEAAKIETDLLKIAHHGSRGSTTPSFLQTSSPRLAFISCGRGNPFGHPAQRVLDELRASGVRVYRTDLDGSIRVTLRPRSVEVSGSKPRMGNSY